MSELLERAPVAPGQTFELHHHFDAAGTAPELRHPRGESDDHPSTGVPEGTPTAAHASEAVACGG
jgi:hypothetical protein